MRKKKQNVFQQLMRKQTGVSVIEKKKKDSGIDSHNNVDET